MSDGVVVARRAKLRPFPNDDRPRYQVRALARHSSQPHVKGFEIKVLGEGASLRHHLHQYVCNLGDVPAWLVWEGEVKLNAGDSAYCRPKVEHRLARIAGAGEPQLLVMRVPGNLTQEALDEYSTFDPECRSRAIMETSGWF
jgi:hypothetical protein